MKRNDYIIAIFFIILAILSYFILHMIIGGVGNYADVTVNGQHYATLNLYENTEIVITGDKGYNILVIQDGEAYMKDADCPDKICVRQGHINKVNQTIVCLPNKVVVKIIGKNDDIDAYVQ
ncbi:MAG: NusG domain II-containing protein [Lacrimispora sphenoides]